MRTSYSSALDLTRLRLVKDVLGADTQRCLESLAACSQSATGVDQFWVRASIRAFFAYLEALTFEMATVVRAAHRAGVLALSEGEAGALLESTWELDDTGRPQSRPRFVPLDRRVRFLFRLFSRAFGCPSEIPVNEVGWQFFRKSLRIRNRLTHPKGPSTLVVSAEDSLVFTSAVQWYFRLVSDLLQRVSERLDVAINAPTQ